MTYEPDLSVPEYTLTYVSLPTCGSDCTLKASAASGPFSSASRVISSPSSVRPSTGGTSSGLGR